jgi:hypothetical protein
LRKVGTWGIKTGPVTINFDSEDRWKSYIENNFNVEAVNLTFSESPERI